jgi:diguanylate cyclase (GGDEF)-like protein
MSRLSGQFWLVSLVVVLLTIAALPHHFQPVAPAAQAAEQIGPAVMKIGPRVLAGTVALVIAVLHLLLWFYRRKPFILGWTTGWAVLGAAMFLASQEYRISQIRVMVYGISQSLTVLSALLFVVSADAYRRSLRWRREGLLVVLPIVVWFALSPVFFGPKAVFAPGHLLTAGALAAAGVAHLLLLRHVRMLGAAVAGAGLLALAGVNAWTTLTLPSPDAPGATGLLMTSVVVYLVTAGGMQLMTFEDMTYQLRRTNRRLEHAQAKLRRMVITDPLTGCRNRRFFDEIIGRELQRHRRYDVPLTLMFIDIDEFKAINDTHGHDVGDDVLRNVAAFLHENIREADYVFRWGGDEFLVLLSCSEQEARRRSAALTGAFTASAGARPVPTAVRLSIGCAEVRDDERDVMSLVKRADGRMYEDKRALRRAAAS